MMRGVIPPLLLLASLMVLTGLAWAMGKVVRHRQISALRELAGQWEMRFVQDDLFQLARRIGGGFPIPGAANVSVRDVVYGVEGPAHRYVFTVEYTLGATGRHRRESRAATFHDPAEPATGDAVAGLKLAGEGLPLPEQYMALHENNWGRGS
jgi:hypothetical protein